MALARRPVPCAPTSDFAELAARFQRAVNPLALIRLASTLGVSRTSLLRLNIGFDGAAWTFPMQDANGPVVGIRRRFEDGRKLSVKGGHEALFVPRDLDSEGAIYICEGPTDTAALLMIGLEAVGRPSCSGAAAMTCELLHGRNVVLVADSDEPGQRGAEALGRGLARCCRDVRIIAPPAGVKDAREWVRRGARREDVERAANEAAPVPYFSARALQAIGGAR